MAANTNLETTATGGENQLSRAKDADNSAMLDAEHGQEPPSDKNNTAKPKAAEGTQQPANLETVLRRIVEHIESTDRCHSEALTDLRERITALGQQTNAAKQGLTNLSTDELIKIEDQVKHLSDRVSSAEQARPESDMRQILEERIAGLAQRISKNDSPSPESAENKSAKQDNEFVSMSQLADELGADITVTVTDGPISEFEDLVAEKEPADGHEETDEEALKTLGDVYESHFKAPEDSPRSAEANLAPSEAVAPTAAIAPQGDSTPNIKATQKPTKAPDERFAQIAVALENTMQHKKIAPAENDFISACFDDLTTRVETMLRSHVKNVSLEPIEKKVAEISAYVEKTEQHFGKINAIESKLMQLIEMVETAQSTITTHTSKTIDAAASRIEEKITKTSQSERLQAIQESIESLAEKGRTTEVQTVDTLEAINKTLSHMVDRLQSVEATGVSTKAELNTIWQSASSMLKSQPEKKTLATPVRKASKPQSAKKPMNIEIAKPTALKSDKAAAAPEPAVAAASAKPEQRPEAAADVGAKVETSTLATKAPPAAAQSKSSNRKEHAKSPIDTAQNGSHSRKEEFISAARRAAQQEAAKFNLTHEESEGSSDSAPLRTPRQIPVTGANRLMSRIGSLVRSLPRPPFVVLSIAAFAASAGILATEKLVQSIGSEINSAQVKERSGKTFTSPVTFEEPAKIRLAEQHVGRTGPVAFKPYKIGDATTARGETPTMTTGRRTTKMTALHALPKSLATASTDDADRTSPPKQSQATPDGKLTGSISKTNAVSTRMAKDRKSAGKAKNTASGVTAPAVRPTVGKLFTAKPILKLQKTNPVWLAHTSPTIRKPATRPQPKPNHALPPTAIGSLSLRRAAANGNITSQYEIALRYAQGKGVKRDYGKAATWFKRAASNGFAPAQYRVATLFERGLGTAKDFGRAQIWYRRAAVTGNVKAMHNLAVLYTKTENGTIDYARAAEWFEKAGAYGLADSQYNLAILYENGLGIDKDLTKSYKWFSLAAARGDKEADKRRRALQGQLSAKALELAKAATKSWRAKSIKRSANVVILPIDGWQSLPNGSSNLLSSTGTAKKSESRKG